MRLADQGDTTSTTVGDVAKFIAGRDAVLGKTATIVEDEDTTAQVLAEFYGGPRRACAALRRLLARLDRLERAS